MLISKGLCQLNRIAYHRDSQTCSSLYTSNWCSRPWIWRLLLFQKSSACLFSLLSSALHLRALHFCFPHTHTQSRPFSNTSVRISCQLGSVLFCIAWAPCECVNVQVIWQKWVKWEKSEIFALSVFSLCQLLDLFFYFWSVLSSQYKNLSV